MEYEYFKRDISWLSFNYRVLLEAEDETLPLYERINFISIYSSNLEEFYKIRVAEHRAIASRGALKEDDVQSATRLLKEINTEVNRQQMKRSQIYEHKILPALRKHHIIFYQSSEVETFHRNFLHHFFHIEILPYLSPVPVSCDKVVSFLRDNRLYLAARMRPRGKDESPFEYFVIKLPYSKVPRFVELPKKGHNRYIMFIEDIIKANIADIFPGYNVDSCYCIKISRDADILIDDKAHPSELPEQVRRQVKKRKIGAVCRFVYEYGIPSDFLDYLTYSYRISRHELMPGYKHLNLEDLCHLPIPKNNAWKPHPIRPACLDENGSVLEYVSQKDLLLHYPYHSFEYFIHMLNEAVHDPMVYEIMVTQYRVAENSSVINSLIAAAQNGKRVTVFVELKARFDEENNLETAEMMKKAGISIIYSLPGLKVHAKVAIITRRDTRGHKLTSYAYISTGNFNERTAMQYADCALITSNPILVNDVQNLFYTLRGKGKPVFHRLLVSSFNLIHELESLISHEISLARNGGQGRIILKMNALQDTGMINRLYEASLAGVQIDLIVRGICCLVPNKTYSRNIRVTRIVDTFLEHARIWYFGNGDRPKIFIGSPDWMQRNLYRRIEAVTPIFDPDLQQELTDMLHIQLADKRKACFVDEHLHNIWKSQSPSNEPVRAQYAFYNYLKQKL